MEFVDNLSLLELLQDESTLCSIVIFAHPAVIMKLRGGHALGVELREFNSASMIVGRWF